MCHGAFTYHTDITPQSSTGKQDDSGGSNESLPGLAGFANHGNVYSSLFIPAGCTDSPLLFLLL